MWSLEVIEDGVIVIKCLYKTVEDAIMAVGMRYYEKEEAHEIKIHLGFIKKPRKEN